MYHIGKSASEISQRMDRSITSGSVSLILPQWTQKVEAITN
jgi:hypothetical protein